jgi:hypothetical protein
MPETAAHPTLAQRLAEFRHEVAQLLGDIDTRVRPKPCRVETGQHLPGPVWEPAEKWTVRVVDPDDTPASVFVNHPHIWDDDILPLDPATARQIGMAFLAAADWADRVPPARSARRHPIPDTPAEAAPTCQAWEIGYPVECPNPARFKADKLAAVQFLLCGHHIHRARRADYYVAEINRATSDA